MNICSLAPPVWSARYLHPRYQAIEAVWYDGTAQQMLILILISFHAAVEEQESRGNAKEWQWW
jgi:hypothetical protein